MEKQGVIKPGVTPPEREPAPQPDDVKTASIVELDADFRKRAAETVVDTLAPRS